jgi:protein O-GlcNAc transferase
MSTMGSDFMDYMIADVEVVPPAHWQFYDEKFVYLPHSFYASHHKQDHFDVLASSEADEALSRQDFGIPEDKFVFAYFNQLYKLSPEILDVWCSILKRVSNSILWLIRYPTEGEENVLAECRKRGVKMDQIVFSDIASSKEEHLKRCKLAEVFLDTSRCNAHGAALDSLWMGTPMISVRGSTMASRVGASILKAAGLQELVCEDLMSYENLAVELAVNADRYIAIRSSLEEGRESLPLFDTERWVSNLERGFDAMWRRHETGSGPDHIKVVEEEGGSEIISSSSNPSSVE